MALFNTDRNWAHIFKPSRLAMPSDPGEIGYLAGIIDGEGTVRLQKCKQRANGDWHFVARVQVANSDLGLLEWLSSIGGFVCEHRSTNVLKTRPHFHWEVSRTLEVRELLEVTFPYLRIKKQRAEEVLNHIYAQLSMMRKAA